MIENEKDLKDRMVYILEKLLSDIKSGKNRLKVLRLKIACISIL